MTQNDLANVNETDVAVLEPDVPKERKFSYRLGVALDVVLASAATLSVAGWLVVGATCFPFDSGFTRAIACLASGTALYSWFIFSPMRVVMFICLYSKQNKKAFALNIFAQIASFGVFAIWGTQYVC